MGEELPVAVGPGDGRCRPPHHGAPRRNECLVDLVAYAAVDLGIGDDATAAIDLPSTGFELGLHEHDQIARRQARQIAKTERFIERFRYKNNDMADLEAKLEERRMDLKIKKTLLLGVFACAAAVIFL